MEQNTVPVSATMWIARCSCGVEVRLAGAFDRPDADCVHCLAGVLWRLYEVREERGWKVRLTHQERLRASWIGVDCLEVSHRSDAYLYVSRDSARHASRYFGGWQTALVSVVRRTLRRVKP